LAGRRRAWRGEKRFGDQEVQTITTLLISHPACLAHDMGEGHPEQPERLRAIERALESEVFQMLARDVAPRADLAAIARVHPLDYIEALRAATPTQGRTDIDQDTSMSPGSFEAALRSAGGAIFAVDEVMTRKARNAFVATRPPGHHAEATMPRGFCFFNNAAIAARHAQAAYGAERVAIVDFDVHHGNGTQHIFWDEKNVMYASTHEMPLFPGTGAIGERGEHDQIVNAPLRAGDTGEVFREAMEVAILPRVVDFAPDLVIVSAGFDAHHRDPLGNLNFVEADFAWITRRLMEIAQKCCAGRMVSVLEGGYDLRALGRSVAAHVTALMEGSDARDQEHSWSRRIARVGVGSPPRRRKESMSASEEMVRERAYELWDRAGRPHGRSDEFWFAAKADFERRGRTGEGQLHVLVRRRVEPCRHETATDWGKRAHASRFWD